jgi:hypothetical protein
VTEAFRAPAQPRREKNPRVRGSQPTHKPTKTTNNNNPADNNNTTTRPQTKNKKQQQPQPPCSNKT